MAGPLTRVHGRIALTVQQKTPRSISASEKSTELLNGTVSSWVPWMISDGGNSRD
jgi:hypothetical protein